MRSPTTLRSGATLLALAAASFGCGESDREPEGVIHQAMVADAALVIRQVYGGGSDTGAPFTHDFIEIFNRRAAPVSLVGLSLQYASETGDFGAAATQLTELPEVVLAPGRSFLVQEAGGSAGLPLPAPDWVDETPIAMSATTGTVALVRRATTLGCNGRKNACSPEAAALIIDLVGYGGANDAEREAAPAPSHATAIVRALGGCADSNDNAADFSVIAPAPRDSASGGIRCAGGPLDRVAHFGDDD